MIDDLDASTYKLYAAGQMIGEIQPRPVGAPHPFKGKTVKDIQPSGEHGWIISFIDGTEFRV
jgi:hypothetical protein